MKLSSHSAANLASRLGLLFSLPLVLVDCGSTAPANSPVNAKGACATVPANSTVNGTNYNATTGHCTSETSGKWTALTVHIPDSGSVTLNATCDDTTGPYVNQSAFDAGEGGNGITSNSDFVLTSTCSSASNHNSTSSTKELFIWTKNP